MNKGFDNNKYIQLQSEKIKERIRLFHGKLYLEFGGKLVDDFHASRVLPGFEPDVKLKILEKLREDAEVIFCINANDIEKKKMRADYGITYDTEVFRLIRKLQELNIQINSVVITLYNGQNEVQKFMEKLKKKNIRTYLHTYTKGYPTDIDTIVSDEGYGANPYIETEKPLVVVTAPGPGSGKLATCLSQLYHEYKQKKQVGYAKFETFPVWNLPVKHPLNMAYEAATADLNDKNMIDYFHLDHYQITATNYNRDLELFPVLKTILYKITKKDLYHSPTDMGVNVVKDCITNLNIVEKASKEEIIRRYYEALATEKIKDLPNDMSQRIKLLMNELHIDTKDRKVSVCALEKKEKEKRHVAAIELKDHQIITGKKTNILMPLSSMLLNAIKVLTNIPDDVDLISPNVLKPMMALKKKYFRKTEYALDLKEVLLALSICSATNPVVSKAMKNIEKLNGCDAHGTYLFPQEELNILKNLGIHITMENSFYEE